MTVDQRCKDLLSDPRIWELRQIGFLSDEEIDNMAMKREERLAGAVELALADYVGTDSFPSDEMPAVARAFAHVVEATSVGGFSPGETIDRAQTLTRAIADLIEKLAGIVE